MGQEASRLDQGDLPSAATRSSSPSPVKPENESDVGSPEPFTNHNTLSEDIAFSSQVPFSASRNRDMFRSNGRKSKSKFERSSVSPEHGVMEPELVTEDMEQGEGVPPTKSAKKKKGKAKKRQSASQAQDDGQQTVGDSSSNIAKDPKSDNGMRAFEPQSSMDLNGASSSQNGNQSPLNENGDTTTDIPNGIQDNVDDEEELRRQERREKKERKKAKRAAKQAEELRSSLLVANPKFGEHVEPEVLPQAHSAHLKTKGGAVDDTILYGSEEVSRSNNQISEESPEHGIETSTQYPTDSYGIDVPMGDLNQLPTPDDEGQRTIESNHQVLPQTETVDPAQSSQTTVKASKRKRIVKDSEKKSRKRRRDQPEPSQEDTDAEGGPSQAAHTTLVTNGTITSPPPPGQSPAVSGAGDSRRPFDEAAREFYSQRYGSTTSSPSKKRTRPFDTSPEAADATAVEDSPSVARLQRQAASSRSSSESYSVKEEERSIEEDRGTFDDMDLDPAAGPTDDYSIHTESDGDQDNDVAMSDREIVARLGSDDLGIESNEKLLDDLGVKSNEKHSGDQEMVETGEQPPRQMLPYIPESPPPQPATSGKAKTLRQYGSKASTSTKRAAKTSYLDRTEEDNVDAFAELPSPAVVAASRKGKSRAKRNTALAVTRSPNAPQSSGKQPKITSMMTDDNGLSSSAPGQLSDKPTLARTFTARLPKRATKVKNPQPEDEIVGPFTASEIHAVNEAIKKWRENNKLTVEQINEMVQKNPQEAKTSEFWDHVHYACPKRKRQKIINQVRKTHHNFVARATWTQEQHDELAELYEIHGKSYKLLGQLINRHPDDVRDRVRNYVICGKNRKSDSWTVDEETRLVAIINEAYARIRHLQVTDRPDLQGQDEEDLVDWTTVSENMGMTRSRLQCRSKWKSLRFRLEGGNIDGKAGHSMKEIVEEARNDFEKMTSLDLFLIAKAIRRSGTLADSRIGWHKLRVAWEAMSKWNRPALMLAWHRLRRAVPEWRLLSVPEIAKHHMDIYKETKEIHVLPKDQMDLDAEYDEMEHKVQKMIKGAHGSTTSLMVTKTDSDEVGRRASTSFGDDEDPEEPAIEPEIEEAKNASRVDRDLEAQSDGQGEAPVSHSRDKPKSRRANKKVPTTIEQSPVVQPEIYVASSDSSPVAKKKRKTRTPRSTTKQASRATKSRKNKPAKQPLSAERVADGDDVSSDTDADDVEDIPAMLPE